MRQMRKAGWAAVASLALPALGQVSTTPTMNPDDLGLALTPTGLTINSVTITAGVAGQFGTYTNFELLPVTIRPGIVLSSGDVTNLGPIPGATDPGYDPASPPAQVNSQMTPDPDSGGTAEFDLFGFTAGNIENFNGSFDVAALRVDFTLVDDSPVKFDFLFGSVEFPYWTSLYTDSFLVFLDGTDPINQITFDVAGNSVQVGSSFAGLETIADLNTAFSNPHGMIHHLTTTTAMLGGGEHFLIFEVGDVNDHILDSAVFIANLRAEAGGEGTDPSEDPPYAGCPHISGQPANTTAFQFSTVSFSVTASGDGPLTYQWRKDGVPIDAGANPSAATATLTLSNVQLSDAGAYRCNVANNCGSETSDPARLTVDPAACPGDVNGDRTVDLADLSILLSNYGCNGSQCPGDFNGDGHTDLSDLATQLGAYGRPCP